VPNSSGPLRPGCSGRNLFDLLPPEFGIPVSDQIAEVIRTDRTGEVDAAWEDRIFHVTVYPVPGLPLRVWCMPAT
jgi:hypothetical protein